MERKNYISKLIFFVIALTMLLSVVFFCGAEIRHDVSASTQHTLIFHCEQYDSTKAPVLIVVEHGSTYDINELPEIPATNGYYEYYWNITAEELTNITTDIHVYAYTRVNPDKKHTVTFLFPDGTIKTVQVMHGEDIVDPPTSENLGFGEKNSYNVSLKNIEADMQVNVTINKTTKYVVISICGAVLVAGLTVIVVVLINMFFKNNNNEFETPSNEVSQN